MAITGTGTQVLKVTSTDTVTGAHAGLQSTDKLMLDQLRWTGVGTGGDDLKVSAEINDTTTILFELKGAQYSDNKLEFHGHKCGFAVDKLVVNTIDSGSLYVYLR